MMKKIIVVLVALVLVFTLSACSKNYTNISNSELTDMLDNHYDEYQFIDVRTLDEYYTSHIEGFTTVIDYYILEDDYYPIDEFTSENNKSRRLSLKGEQYKVNWRVSNSNLEIGLSYRIVVDVAGQELGFVNIEISRKGNH